MLKAASNSVAKFWALPITEWYAWRMYWTSQRTYEISRSWPRGNFSPKSNTRSGVLWSSVADPLPPKFANEMPFYGLSRMVTRTHLTVYHNVLSSFLDEFLLRFYKVMSAISYSSLRFFDRNTTFLYARVYAIQYNTTQYSAKWEDKTDNRDPETCSSVGSQGLIRSGMVTSRASASCRLLRKWIWDSNFWSFGDRQLVHLTTNGWD